MEKSFSESYKEAGVDVTAGYKSVELMKSYVQNTYTEGVIGDLGGFGGLFAPNITNMKKPILVSGTDGVGTKLKLAFLMNKHDTIGQDCVAMCVNDIVCSGAKPLFFLDYMSLWKNIPEMVATIVHQLTRNLTPEEIKESGFGDYYIDHTLGIWPQAAGGVPFNACEFQVKGDPITDIVEDMAAEQKARSTYDNILRVVKDPDVIDPIRFLRAREVVHFQRFGEALRIIQEHLDSKNFYAFNPAIDKNCK